MHADDHPILITACWYRNILLHETNPSVRNENTLKYYVNF